MNTLNGALASLRRDSTPGSVRVRENASYRPREIQHLDAVEDKDADVGLDSWVSPRFNESPALQWVPCLRGNRNRTHCRAEGSLNRTDTHESTECRHLCLRRRRGAGFRGAFELCPARGAQPGVESRRSDASAPFNVFTVAQRPAPVTVTGGYPRHHLIDPRRVWHAGTARKRRRAPISAHVRSANARRPSAPDRCCSARRSVANQQATTAAGRPGPAGRIDPSVSVESDSAWSTMAC